MRILMMTNTYKPITGGLEKSVEFFSREYQKRGHHVLIVAPEYKNYSSPEENVHRVPAIQNFNGTDFSVELPIHFDLSRVLDRFRPQIVHSHHPFLIGDTALRIAAKGRIPIIFTHHTRYEENTHYVPWDSNVLKQFVTALATGYANLCDTVFAPSESIAELIQKRGVTKPVEIVPTGIYSSLYRVNQGRAFRARWGIPDGAFVAGTVGRIAPEKNIEFLTSAVAEFLRRQGNAVFLVVGGGELLDSIRGAFRERGCSARLFCSGVLHGKELVAAYHAMDVFAFASHSETQGLVLLEAMASGIPVVAVDAPGVREVVCDRINGGLIPRDDTMLFADTLERFYDIPPEQRTHLKKAAQATAERFKMSVSAEKALGVYESLLNRQPGQRTLKGSYWDENIRLIRAEMSLARTLAKATSAVLTHESV